MDLWIRSQDREELIPIKNKLKVYKGDLIQTGIHSYEIERRYNILHDTDFLGEYNSEERALEVLDEIQKYKDKLENAWFLGMTESTFVSSTYEMPKE